MDRMITFSSLYVSTTQTCLALGLFVTLVWQIRDASPAPQSRNLCAYTPCPCGGKCYVEYVSATSWLHAAVPSLSPDGRLLTVPPRTPRSPPSRATRPINTPQYPSKHTGHVDWRALRAYVIAAAVSKVPVVCRWAGISRQSGIRESQVASLYIHGSVQSARCTE